MFFLEDRSDDRVSCAKHDPRCIEVVQLDSRQPKFECVDVCVASSINW